MAELLGYLLMFVEKPIDYDDFLNKDPEECATLFFANAKAQKGNMWAGVIVKWVLTITVFFAALPLYSGSSYDIWIDEQDYYFNCAMGQPGFT